MGKGKREEVLTVECSSGVSPKCKGIYNLTRRSRDLSISRNGCVLCLFCSRRTKFMGSGNPNIKYKYDRSFLHDIDDDYKAYLLGWIASDGSIEEGLVKIQIHKKDVGILESLRDYVCRDIPIKTNCGERGNQVSFSICSKEVVSDVCKWLNISPGKKAYTIGFPDLQDESLTWAYIRGLFDGDGWVCDVHSKKRSPRCGIGQKAHLSIEGVKNFVSIPCSQSKRGILEWNGNNALDFLSKLYENAPIYLSRKKALYEDLCCWVPSLNGKNNSGDILRARWNKADPDAFSPSKTRASDSGYDLTLIRKVKTAGLVDFFTTGIKITPEFGWYFDLVGRSSISKSGYMLANGFGVIDRSYIGEIIVPLIKIDPSAPEIQLPARLVQLIPRPIVHFEIVEVSSLQETSRSKGGFGSTGVK